MKNLYPLATALLCLFCLSGKAQPIRNALSFDGNDGYVQLANPLNIGESSNTIECWVRVPEPGPNGLGTNDRVGMLAVIGTKVPIIKFHLTHSKAPQICV